MKHVKRYVLTFPPECADKPISYELVKNYDIKINILKAEIRSGIEGTLLLEMQSEKKNIDQALEYLSVNGVGCEPLTRKISFLEEKCICCGNCTAVCFTGALKMDNKKWELNFDKEKCVVCELCTKAC
ncbi:NIL domain-containing protein, partial [Bacteroidota bacterium]